MKRDALVTVIDADSIPYIVGWNHRETQDVDIVLKHVDSFITNILNNTNAHYYMGFIGGKPCFRYEIAQHKPYKGQRKEDPDWYKRWAGVIKAHMRDQWGFMVVNGIEADDAVSICQRSLVNSTIASTDKDLKQIPGNHYNMKTNQGFYVEQEEAERFFWKQMITGDTVDNIEGIKGRGPAFANKLVDSIVNVDEIEWAVVAEYEKVYGTEYGNKLFTENYHLLHMLTASVDLPKVEYLPWKYKEEVIKSDKQFEDFNDIFEQWQHQQTS